MQRSNSNRLTQLVRRTAHERPATFASETELGADDLVVHGYEDRLDDLRVLAHGGQFLVLAASDRALGGEVVVKVPYPESYGPRVAEQLRRAGRLSRAVGTHRLVTVYDITSAEFRGVPLDCLIQERGQARLDEIEASPAHKLRNLRQAAQAMLDLHYRGVALLDFKASDVVRFGSTMKLVDLGCATPVNEVAARTELPVSSCSAPEILSGCAGIGRQSDLFSLGVVIAEILLGQPLFPAHIATRELQRLHRRHLPIRDTGIEDLDVAAVVRTLTDAEPTRRGKAKDVVSVLTRAERAMFARERTTGQGLSVAA